MVIKENIWYEPAGEDRTLHIYLPDGYENSDERYPVLYFFDGHNLYFDEDATYGKSWGLKSFLDGWDRDLIVVGIECSHAGTHRLDEYCPYDAELMGTSIHGEGRETLDWMTERLKPYIDAKYRTCPSRETTAIAGSSMGGLMSLYAVTMYNSVFSKAACVSSSIFMVLEPLIGDIDSCTLDPDTRVYLSWGSREGGADPDSNFCKFMSSANHRVESFLQKKNVRTYLYCQQDGGHCEADWEKQIPIFMDFLYRAE